MSCDPVQTVEYRCPGQPYPISRSVHLGRLAAFYPGCRQCRHRDDTGPLSQRHVEQLTETRSRGFPRRLFHDEGAAGEYLNELTPATAREMAAALGICLQRHGDAPRQQPPVATVAGDGRPMSSSIVAAVAEGLRWAGCHVVDIGAASAPCLASAIDQLRTDGGILVGNPDDRPQTVGLKFWAAGARPLSAGGTLEPLMETYEQGTHRPTRTYGSLRRFRADTLYLNALAEHYHAMRPLRFVLHTACKPLIRYLERLTESVACRIIPGRTAVDRLAEQVVEDQVHFAARMGDDGETLQLLDEQGRRVSDERLLLLVARHLIRNEPQGTVVLEEETGPAVVEVLGCRVAVGGNRRADMEAAMRRHGAKLGGGSTGRFWYADPGPPLPDALMTLTLLLVILSQSDRPLSEVLDRQAPER